MVKIALPEKVNILIGQLEGCGYEAFAVGGCIRDSIMGRIPNDWDLCTSATPEEMKSCFTGFKVIETGLQHGTLTVLLEGEAFEITTYRIDGEYSDGRHPDAVTFSRSIEEDLARRDFTVNAMAYNESVGLVDPFGGCADLKNCILRCVGDPVRRFTEDSLRILRGVRFASQLGFELDAATVKGMYQCLPLMDRVAAERIRVEFDKLLCGSAAADVLRAYRNVIAHIIPEIQPMFDLDQKNAYHSYDVWEHTLQVIDNIPADPLLRLTAFFHDIGKPSTMTVVPNERYAPGALDAGADFPEWGHFYGHEPAGAEITNTIMRRLKYDNATRESVCSVIDAHKIVFQPTQKHARRLLLRLGEDQLRMLIRLELADVKGQNPVYTAERVDNILAFEKCLEEVLAAEQCFSMKHLAVDGRDMIGLGIPQGRQIGRILNTLLEQVVEGNLPNEKAALLQAASKLM